MLTIKKNYKIIIIFFSLINLFFLLWGTNVFKHFSPDLSSKNNQIPVIDPVNKTIKEKPEELELFPHSESPIWNAFKENSNQLNKDSEKVPIKKNAENNLIKENDKTLNSSINNKDNNEEIELNVKDKKSSKKDKKSELKQDNEIKLNKKKEVKIEKKDNEINIEKTEVYYIQLASVSDENLVSVEWKRLLGIYPELSLKKYQYKKIMLKDGSIYFRILLGEFKSKTESLEFCKKILKKSNCILRTYE